MTLNLSSLSVFSEPSGAVPTLKASVRGDTVYRLASVLAFDQSLGNCGWVLVSTAQGVLNVLDFGTIKSRADLNLRSNTDALTAHDELTEAIITMVCSLDCVDLQGLEWVHEAPPNMGKVPGGGVSSMLAAAAVRSAARHFDQKVHKPVGAQTAKKALTGSAKAEKPAVRAAVEALPIVGKRPTNEHTREALAIAAVHLLQRS